ncbi:MAG: PAS domain S-box protein, partial [Methylovulum sp.]|nr:PAS domain S-box protein [Methylovulum sp.]
PDYRQQVMGIWSLAMQQAAEQNTDIEPLEFKITRKDGCVRDVVISGITVSTDVLVTLVDITERKQAEAELKLWAQSFESANFGLVVTDAKTNRFLAVNPAFASERGYSREELVGQPITALYPEELVAKLKAKLQAIDASSHGVFESVHIRKDGSRFPVMLDITSIKSANGEAVTRIAYALNLTEKKQAEARLRLSEERLKLAIEATSDGIWDWNIPDDNAYLTPRYYEMIGVASNEGPTDFNFFKNTMHPDDFPLVLAEMNAHLQGKTQSSEIEYRVTLPSGSVKWILGRGKVVERNADGSPVRMAGTITDISQRKAAEESLRRNTEELSQRNAELERFNRLMIGRELDIIALKQQVNELSRQLDRPPPYPLAFLNADS